MEQEKEILLDINNASYKDFGDPVRHLCDDYIIGETCFFKSSISFFLPLN